jgi:hypothetical protein
MRTLRELSNEMRRIRAELAQHRVVAEVAISKDGDAELENHLKWAGFDGGACSGCVGGTRWRIVVESPIVGIKLLGK